VNPVLRTALCPGSFDPVTNGHLDLIRRAAGLFDRVVVAVLVNETKRPLLDADTRVSLLRRALADVPNADVTTFDGLLVDCAASHGATAIVRGLRHGADFDYEWPMTVMNRRLAPSIETLFLVPNPEVAPISSSLVKEVWKLGGDVSGLVPDAVADELGRRRALEQAR
jgi:pantetheine-phosphate adenylyltransferase